MPINSPGDNGAAPASDSAGDAATPAEGLMARIHGHRPLRSIGCRLRRSLLVLGLALSSTGAPLAQPAAPTPDRTPGPFRILNSTGGEGMQLYLVRSGEDWGPSRLGQPLAPGAMLNLRARPDGGCRFDARLVLADGREAVARDHDICALPTITLDRLAPADSGPRAPGLLRIANRTGMDALQFYLAAAGEPWGANRLSQPLAAGGDLLQRAGARATCRVDIRLVLADGREEVRRGQDICALPSVALGDVPPPRVAEVAARPPGPTADRPDAGPRASSGSGFIVAAGRVLTNRHVVDGCARLLVHAPDGRSLAAASPGRTDAKLDLAVLEVPRLRGPALTFRSNPVRRGEGVVAFGFPLAGLLSSDPKLTRGEVNGLNGLRDDPDRFQVSAAVQPGNSGGPLLDLHGHVLGVVVAKLNAQTLAQRTGDIAQNVNFAVKGNRAAAFLRAGGVPFATAESRGAERSAADVGEVAQRSTVFIRCER